jgi:hypothetical protein
MATRTQRDPRQQEQRSFSLKVRTGIKAGPMVTLGGKELEVDEDGFIQQPDLWDKEVAV